jgi:LCP family protein required for cell wall assembly
MKKHARRNRWKTTIPRPHKRGRNAVYPLKRRSTVAAAASLPTGAQSDSADISVPKARTARGVRRVAWLIMAIVPLMLLSWALYVIVPTAIEARRAESKIFQTPVPRIHYDNATPVELTPLAVVEAPPTTGPTATNAPPTATLAPDAPTPTPAPPTQTPFPEWTGKQPVTILLLGVDSREGETDPPRSDTMIIVRVDPVAKRVDMVAIPRDLLVDIPGFYATKVNAAYPFGEVNKDTIPGGGATLAAQTVELNFGIRIDYFAEIDIAGLEKVIDTLGGVFIDVTGIVKDDQYPTSNYGYTRVYFSPGLQWMNGQTAVRYARTRHDDGDFMRNRRQQQVLLAMRDRALQTGIISKLPTLISELGDSVRTDLSPRQVLSLTRLGQSIDPANIFTHSIAPLVQAQDIDGGFYYVGDWDAIRGMVDDMPSDPNARTSLEPQDAPLPAVSPTPDGSPLPTEAVPVKTPSGVEEP